jgi:citrate lyase synthetase
MEQKESIKTITSLINHNDLAKPTIQLNVSKRPIDTSNIIKIKKKYPKVQFRAIDNLVPVNTLEFL